MASDMYGSRIKHLREKKERQTLEKLEKNGYMNEDDYGSVLPPEDFHFSPDFNDETNHTFYGAKLWARNFRRLMQCHPVYIDPEDAIAGRWMFILQRLRPFDSAVSMNNMEMAPVFNYDYLKPYHEKYCIVPGIGKMHHFAPDYEMGLKLGFGGLRKKVETYRALNPEAEEMYEAELEVLDGIQSWVQAIARKAADMRDAQTDPALKENLMEMAQAVEWIEDNPPRSFREACQWIAVLNMCNRTYNRAGAGMQLDETLRPYYERDVRQGVLDDEKAKYIIACLFINDPHYYQIGGPAPDGSDMTSQLSFLILEAAHMAKTSINLTIRVHDGMDERLMRRGLEVLFEDRKGFPRFSGDKALVEGFMKNGYSAEIARKRIAVGCHWMSLPGLEYTLNDLIKINLAKVFEVAYSEYRGEKERTSEGLYTVFTKHLRIAIRAVANGIDFHLTFQHLNAPELVLNLLSHGPIERGLDVSNGGVDNYNICVDASGIATVADSFGAITQRIEAEGALSWEQCDRALDDNFAGVDGERTRLMLASAKKFGHGFSAGDEWAKRISHDFAQLVSQRPTPGGRLMIPGLFSWANTINLGEKVAATPNGRFAFEPISHGANPDPGFRKDGAFTAMAKAIAMVQPGYGNTAPFQLELNPTILNRENVIDLIEAVIKTHFDLGGTLVNINIIDAETLRQAHNDPMKFPNLVVRVTGFTAYFVALSPEFRQLVIDRVINDR